jgi:hypothetical protein
MAQGHRCVAALSRSQRATQNRVRARTQAPRSHAVETAGAVLEGKVEVDGAYFGGHIRSANKKEDRKDRRLAEHQTGMRRVVVAFRQRKGCTITRVVRNEGDGVDIAKQIVSRTAIMHGDEASHWDALHRVLDGGDHRLRGVNIRQPA